MAEWMDIARWNECAQMARPGIIFELKNSQGQSLFSSCTGKVPATPFGWTSPPVLFRAVTQPKPEHSAPMPPPVGAGGRFGHGRALCSVITALVPVIALR